MEKQVLGQRDSCEGVMDTVDLETFVGRKLKTRFSDHDSVLVVGWGVVQYKLNSGRAKKVRNSQQQYRCYNFAKYVPIC